MTQISCVFWNETFRLAKYICVIFLRTMKTLLNTRHSCWLRSDTKGTCYGGCTPIGEINVTFGARI